MPDFLAPQVEDLEPWEWPEFDDLEIPHVMSLGKKTYNWIKRNHKLLIIKQKLDEDGRISDLSFAMIAISVISSTTSSGATNMSQECMQLTH